MFSYKWPGDFSPPGCSLCGPSKASSVVKGRPPPTQEDREGTNPWYVIIPPSLRAAGLFEMSGCLCAAATGTWKPESFSLFALSGSEGGWGRRGKYTFLFQPEAQQ